MRRISFIPISAFAMLAAGLPGALIAAIALLTAAPSIAADQRYETGPVTEKIREVRLPTRFPRGVLHDDSTPKDNPITEAGVRLGRVLFYDRGLSANGLVSCSSCHAQANGFDDPTRFSIGFQGKITRRSAMALANARFNPRGRYFHDERAATLEDQVLMPLTDGIEMGLKPEEVTARVARRQWYGPLFEDTFGDPMVTETRIARALAQFVRSLSAFDSRFDRARAAHRDPLEDFPEFTAEENRGKFLFFARTDQGGADCAACHRGDAFFLVEPRDNGLPAVKGRPDDGVAETTSVPTDKGRFRTSSLKNIAVSAPYMHDGRFATLEEVIEHYSTGIADKPNLAPELRGEEGRPLRLDLSDADKAAIVAFLKTLTDEAMLIDPRLSDPFSVR